MRYAVLLRKYWGTGNREQRTGGTQNVMEAVTATPPKLGVESFVLCLTGKIPEKCRHPYNNTAA